MLSLCSVKNGNLKANVNSTNVKSLDLAKRQFFSPKITIFVQNGNFQNFVPKLLFKILILVKIHKQCIDGENSMYISHDFS